MTALGLKEKSGASSYRKKIPEAILRQAHTKVFGNDNLVDLVETEIEKSSGFVSPFTSSIYATNSHLRNKL